MKRAYCYPCAQSQDMVPIMFERYVKYRGLRCGAVVHWRCSACGQKARYVVALEDAK